MKSIKITVTDCLATVTETLSVVSGTVGLPVEFTFDDTWESLRKTAVFRANGKTLDVLNITNSATVPWELLKTPGCRLWAGVYGTNPDGSLQIPTVWADLGVIQPGADPSGDESADPSLPVWEQVKIGSVSYSEKQELSEIEKKIARMNIGAMEYGESITVDQQYDPQSENAQSGKAVAGALKPLENDIHGLSDEIHALKGDIENHTELIDDLNSDMGQVYRDIDFLKNKAQDHDEAVTRLGSVVQDLDWEIGDIETALDSILAIQESLLGGGAE